MERDAIAVMVLVTWLVIVRLMNQVATIVENLDIWLVIALNHAMVIVVRVVMLATTVKRLDILLVIAPKNVKIVKTGINLITGWNSIPNEGKKPIGNILSTCLKFKVKI